MALGANNILLVGEGSNTLVDFVIRYTRGQEISEDELQSFLKIPPGSIRPETLDAIFVNHFEHVTKICQTELKDLGVYPEPLDLLNKILYLWKEVVLPATLKNLGVLDAKSQDFLKLCFATTIRDLSDTDMLVQWLSGEDNLHHLNEICQAGLDEETNAVLAKIIPRKIENYVVGNWKGRYEPGVPEKVKTWVLSVLIPEVRELLTLLFDQQVAVPTSQLTEIAITMLARLRISELYEIVNTEQRLGLEDLAFALANRRELREETVKSYIEQCEELLLNGASDTVDIVLMLLRTIHAFSILDPQGVLLEKVSKPIHAMLKERPDTNVRLAEGLFGETASPLSFLFDDLQNQAKPKAKISVLQSFDNWEPDPIDTPADFVRKQTQDSVSALLDLYDNKEVFVKQFVKLFGSELLNKPFGSDSSVQRLKSLFDLLSARFGTSTMQKIAVMLGDVERSEKIDTQIHAVAEHLRNLSPLVLSRLYWPSVLSNAKSAKEKLQLLPHNFQTLLDEYSQVFTKQQGCENLELQWLPSQGRVTLELNLADRDVEMTVEPAEAILISAFDNDTPSLTLAELIEATHLGEDHLRNALRFWVNQGVLGVDGERYKVLETLKEAEEHRSAPTQIVDPRFVSTSGDASNKQAADAFEEMHIYWSYIVGMLTNLGALPLDKIHSFLVMFVPNEDPYVKTKQELENYLLAMVDNDKLKHEDGKYSLVKK